MNPVIPALVELEAISKVVVFGRKKGKAVKVRNSPHARLVHDPEEHISTENESAIRCDEHRQMKNFDATVFGDKPRHKTILTNKFFVCVFWKFHHPRPH